MKGKIEYKNHNTYISYRFNKKFISRGVNKTNEVYGGMKIKATRIVFIHGEIDPWNRLGITKTNRRSNFDSILIRGNKSRD